MPNMKILSERLFLNLSENGFQKFERELHVLIESMENKPDPDLSEIRLTSSLYEFNEKLQILKHNLKSYVAESVSNKHVGNFLSRLYDYNDNDKYLDTL